MRLQDKVTIITGGASGMGRVAARMFAAEGAKVVVAARGAEAAQSVVDEVTAAGGQAIAVVADVSKEADAKRMIDETIAAFGRVDVLYNNAGIMPEADHSVIDTSVEDWDRVMAVNVRGVFLGCKYAISAMKETGGGSIVNMSSVAALGALPMFCAYSASKGAVAAMTRAIALHCKQQGYRIRVNSVHPDGINTPMTQALTGGQPIPQDVLDSDPMNRMAAPRDIANVVLFLASDESRFINGAEIRVDNGQLISGL